MFAKIKKWYAMGLWTDEMVLKAVAKCVLTENEATEILNKEVV